MNFIPQTEIQNGIFKTTIDGLYFITRSKYEDERGFFSEIARMPELDTITGNQFVVKQINHARSDINVIRGIHAEGWNKFIFVTQGSCFCALADLRKDSSTYQAVETFQMGNDGLFGSLYVPQGVGNSYLVTQGPMDYVYFVDRLYADRDTSGDAAISLFDPTLNIPWPISRDQMIISERDRNCVMLKDKIGL
ncbi:MAG: dTDP-4-dehydrorhamnose 3,5-epimerase family protein [bacterium]|nr:dTDP-4-dehydrorhamnose 3,5-epimerase family protein [bacterium]